MWNIPCFSLLHQCTLAKSRDACGRGILVVCVVEALFVPFQLSLSQILCCTISGFLTPSVLASLHRERLLSTLVNTKWLKNGQTPRNREPLSERDKKNHVPASNQAFRVEGNCNRAWLKKKVRSVAVVMFLVRPDECSFLPGVSWPCFLSQRTIFFSVFCYRHLSCLLLESWILWDHCRAQLPLTAKTLDETDQR
jgi:hypothetical protein